MEIENFSYFMQPAARTDLLRLIPSSVEKVLDVGVGIGRTGQVLQQMGFKDVVGAELNKEAALKAQEHYSNIIVGDVEHTNLNYPDGYFDCIIYGDILEHLVDPWALLSRHKLKLSKKGFVVASIPNIRFYKVLLGLLFKGRWDYAEAGGILDLTHLRFFTLKTIHGLFKKSGFRILRIERNLAGRKTYKRLNRLLLGSITEFLVWQYVILAEPE